MSPSSHPIVTPRRRAAAAAALLFGVLAVGAAGWLTLTHFPRGPIVAAALVLGLVAGWQGVLRRGAARWVGLATAVVIGVVSFIAVVGDEPLASMVAVGCMWLALAAARAAFHAHVVLPPGTPPRRPVLLLNPRSGGGAAARVHLADEARARGIEPVELTPGADLEALARDAVARGADALAMAGGDGSQAIVATVAAEHGLPYACIPAGTRNHFALDLGVDREDVVGALDALVDGGERVVDLGEINGRVFVNNVSLGLYADAVQREGYRDAKLRTILDTVPDAFHGENGLDLRWRGPDGHEHRAGAAILVSNNQYRLGRAIGSGTRPLIDEGLLGVTVLGRPVGRGRRGRGLQRPWRSWTAPTFEVDAEHDVAAGIDGEAVRLAPPLRFRVRHAALRVRIARHHPGASPSAFEPEGAWAGVRDLLRIAAGRSPAARG